MTNQGGIEALQAPLGAAPAPMTLIRRYIRDFAEGDQVGAVFAVRERERRTRRSGEDFMRARARRQDRHLRGGRVGGLRRVVRPLRPRRRPLHQRPVLDPRALRVEDHDQVDPPRRRRRVRGRGPRRGPAGLGRPARGEPARAAGDDPEPAARALLDRIFGENSKIWARFRVAPAAKYYHQAYPHGLLDHTVSVAQAVSAAAAAFGGVDRDIAITGALLHDIGKTQAYNDDPLAIDLTDAGRLLGEIPLGYYIVRRTIESIDGFDPELAKAVLHIILSHHGKLENGSPVVPATREATLVHMMDNLGGTLGSFDRIERELPEGQAWSRFDRGIDSAAYFPKRAA